MEAMTEENKAKPMKKRSLHKVNEHFEEVSTQLSCVIAFMH